MLPGISDSPWYDLIKNRRRQVRWNDVVHSSVAFADDCNNPPDNIGLVGDDGDAPTGRFTRRPSQPSAA